MSLELEINNGIKQAMLAKETVRLTALRAIKAEILLAKTADGSSEVSDDTVLKIVQKLVKQRRESAAVYIQKDFLYPPCSKNCRWGSVACACHAQVFAAAVLFSAYALCGRKTRDDPGFPVFFFTFVAEPTSESPCCCNFCLLWLPSSSAPAWAGSAWG